jgi:hypothetical protein
MKSKAAKREEVAVEERIELYYAAHPTGAAALRRPRMTKQGGVWVAILGANIQKGVVGIGPTVEAALRAFDTQYLYRLRPMAA